MKERRNAMLRLTAILLGVFILSACQSRVSDSGMTQRTFGTNVDSKIYHLDVTMLGNPTSNTETNAAATQRQYSDIYDYGNIHL